MDPVTVNIIGALLNLGGLGILSAVLFYLHTSALKEFKEERSASRVTFADEQDQIRKLFKEEQKCEREMCDKHFQQMMATQEKTQEALAKQTSILESVWRHELVNKEHVAGIKRAIDEKLTQQT